METLDWLISRIEEKRRSLGELHAALLQFRDENFDPCTIGAELAKLIPHPRPKTPGLKNGSAEAVRPAIPDTAPRSPGRLPRENTITGAILATLETAGRAMAPRELRAKIDVTASTLGSTLHRLRAAGHVTQDATTGLYSVPPKTADPWRGVAVPREEES